jgi:hypothetical protein
LLLRLESAGLVSKLYRVEDVYNVSYDPGLCATSLHLEALEGRRKRDTRVTFDRARTRVVVQPRSFLDAGTNVVPGERKFTDYVFPPGYGPGSVPGGAVTCIRIWPASTSGKKSRPMNGTSARLASPTTPNRANTATRLPRPQCRVRM